MGTTLNLRLFRKANKLTQDAVADYLGVTKGFISQGTIYMLANPT